VPDQKGQIYYHRAYKRAQTMQPGLGRLLFVLILLLDVVVFIYYPQIVKLVTISVKNVLMALGYFPSIFYWKMLYRPIDVLDMPTVYPTPAHAVGMLIFSTLLIVFVLAINKVPRLLAVYLTFISIINAISACFFILTPLDFPYTIADFCMLYIGTEVGLWLLIPVILSIALYAMPASLTSKFLFIVFNLVYSIIFGTVRYLVFLSLMQDYSVIWMFSFYFAFGPLFDYVYLVGFYTLFVSNLSEVISTSFERWRWLY